jgi:hypothetical protein
MLNAESSFFVYVPKSETLLWSYASCYITLVNCCIQSKKYGVVVNVTYLSACHILYYSYTYSYNNFFLDATE